MVLTAEPTTALIRLRGLPWLRADEQLVPVAIYLGDPGELVEGCDVVEVSWSWGAGDDSGVTTAADAGTGVIRLLDPDRKYDPLTPTDSTGIATTVRILVAGVPAFRGRIDDVKHDLDVATLTIVDSVGSLAAIQFVETSCPAEVSSARVTRILDLAGWPADRRDVAAGGVQLQAGTLAADAWSELLEVARNELGAVWLTPAGVVTFRPRAAAWSATQTEYVVNGGFEQLDDPGSPYPWPTGWAAYPSPSCLFSSPPDASINATGRLLYKCGNATSTFAYQWVDLTPGETYTVSALGCIANGPAGRGRVQLVDPNASGASLAILEYTNLPPTLVRKSATFVAPAGGRVQVEVGMFEQPDGSAIWVDDVSIAGPPAVPLAELGCPPSTTYLTSLALAADQSALVNVLAAARRGGTQRTVSDPPSLERYGRHSHVQNDLEVATDGDRDLWQAFYLTRQREPARGVESVSARPGASAIATLLGLPFGGVVHVKDQGHGPDVDVLARWLGTRWTATPSAVLVEAVLGQDQSIAPAQRSLVIDTPAEWSAVTGTGYANVDARNEPGMTVYNWPGYVAPAVTAKPAPDEPGPAPKRRRRPKAT
jgi:hypothetical protein